MIHSGNPSTLTWCSYTNMNNLANWHFQNKQGTARFNEAEKLLVDNGSAFVLHLGFNFCTQMKYMWPFVVMILIAVSYQVSVDGSAGFLDVVFLFSFGLVVAEMNPFRCKAAFNRRWMPRDPWGSFVNGRLVFLRWYSLLCSFVVMFLFAVLYSYNRNGTRVEYLMVAFSEVFYGAFKCAVAISRLKSMCRWPCANTQLFEVVSSALPKDYANVYTPEDLLWEQSFYLHMRVRNTLVWVLIGFFTRIVMIFVMDLIESRMTILENAQRWDGPPCARRSLRAQPNTRMRTPDDPFGYNYGPVMVRGGAGWFGLDYSQVLPTVTAAENSMITMMLNDVTFGHCVDMTALVWVAMNALVPMAVECYTCVWHSLEPRSVARRRSAWDARPVISFLHQSVLFWTVVCCVCMACLRWSQVRACTGPWFSWLCANVFYFCVRPVMWTVAAFTLCLVLCVPWQASPLTVFTCLVVFVARWGWALPTPIGDGGSGNSSPIGDGGSGNSSPVPHYL